MKIAVIPNLTKPDAFLLTERAVKTLLSLHAEALLSEEQRSVFSQSGATFAPESELYKSCLLYTSNRYIHLFLNKEPWLSERTYGMRLFRPYFYTPR